MCRHGELFWKEEENNFGLKMMNKMGWEQGKVKEFAHCRLFITVFQGLGKNESGNTSFVRTKKKNDTLGMLGAWCSPRYGS